MPLGTILARQGDGANVYMGTISGTGIITDPAVIAHGDVNLGEKTDTIATTDTGTFTFIALFKRFLDRLTTLFGTASLLSVGRVKVEATTAVAALSDYNAMGTQVAQVIKGSAGNLYMIAATNLNSSTRYLQLFDRTTVPSGGTTPLKCYPVYGNGFTPLDLAYFGVAAASQGLYFANGICWAMSTTALTYTAATAAETIVEARYL
jgi:hypothetical protein